jgi:hypothetical protein
LYLLHVADFIFFFSIAFLGKVDILITLYRNCDDPYVEENHFHDLMLTSMTWNDSILIWQVIFFFSLQDTSITELNTLGR